MKHKALVRERDLSGLGNVLAHWYRLDPDTTRQTGPDDLAIIFPGQFQSPMVVIAVRVFPIERHRPIGNFDVVNGEVLGKSRVGYNVDRACGFRIHTIAAYLYATDKLTFRRAQMQNNNWSSGMDSRPCSYERQNLRFWRLHLG